MTMKKSLVVLIISCLSLMIFSSIALGLDADQISAPDHKVIVTQNQEITDINQLYLRAQANIQDAAVPMDAMDAYLLSDEKTAISLDDCSTTQLLEETVQPDGTIEQSVAQTIFYDVPVEMVTRGSGNLSEEQWDSTLAVRAYSTIYWTTSTTSSGNAAYLLTKVVGGWQVADSSTSVINREVKYWCGGTNKTQYPSRNSYSYNTGFTESVSNDYVGSGDFAEMLGMKAIATLKRGSSTWSLNLYNHRSFN